MKFSNIIFDMDGVLINSEEIRAGMWRECAEKYNFSLTDEEIEAFAGSPDRENCETCYKNGCDRSIDLLKEQTALYRELQPTRLAALPGVTELLSFLKESGVKIAVASTTRREMLSRSLFYAGLAEYFDIIASGDEVENLKPAPDLYLLALKRLSAEAESTAAVEDSPYGIKAAKAAGLFVFGFLSTYPEQALRDAGADFIVPSHKMLLSEVKQP